MSRVPILAGNWKMNMLRADAEAFCSRLDSELASALGEAGPEVVIFPPFTLITDVAGGLKGSVAQVGGQDLHSAPSGAHTGDVSAAHLIDAGCGWALCGHSERRSDHGESDAQVAEKAKAAIAAGLKPMICIGETGEERAAGKTFEVLERQVAAALEAIEGADAWVLAYEPVWAIGTGETATPEVAQQAHVFIRRMVSERLGAEAGQELRILYGGSAKPANVEELFAQNDIDGFLVGGASLDSEKFLTMIRSCARAAR